MQSKERAASMGVTVLRLVCHELNVVSTLSVFLICITEDLVHIPNSGKSFPSDIWSSSCIDLTAFLV